MTIFEQDFPDSAKRMLNMMEWWKCMSMPPEEAEQIARFRDLSEEERALLLAAGFCPFCKDAESHGRYLAEKAY